MAGTVYLVGAGPGDPSLFTRRGADLLARADVVLFDGSVSAALLDLAPPAAERISVSKRPADLGLGMDQVAINELMVDRARAGSVVVRLQGGDPFAFGRAAEEASYLAAADVAFEIVPGVSTASAVPAYAGIPLAGWGAASTVAFATGLDVEDNRRESHDSHDAGDSNESINWGALARTDTVVFMARRTLADCTQRLFAAGKAADTPTAAIHAGTTTGQRTVVATLATLASRVDAAGLTLPVLIIVGNVVRYRAALSWYEQRPLFGARVLISRGSERARRFAAALSDLGAQPVFAPVTRLQPPTDRAALDAALAQLARYQWVVFTSANAVRRLFDELRAGGRDARALGGTQISCVGPVTAAMLADYGIRADVVPEHGDASTTAAAIVEVAGGSLAGDRVLLPRAEDGRNEAALALERAGAVVDIVASYRTETAPVGDPSVRRGLHALRRRRVEIAALFAPSQVRALVELCRQSGAAAQAAEAVDIINGCRIIAAIGNTTAQAMRACGIRVDLVASTPTADVLAEELAAAYRAAGS